MRPFANGKGQSSILKNPLIAILTAALLVSGCFKKNESQDEASAPAPTNSKPTISGSPPMSLRVGETYRFTPTASDPDGDSLSFSIERKPSWANFDASTGRLEGQPQAADVGVAADIRISVSDGTNSTALPTFSININQIALGSATLSWMPPIRNSDGSALTDLAGYRIYYGRDANVLDQVATLGNPGLTSYVVENLSSATWYFAMTSFNSGGVESALSAIASKKVE